MPDWYRDHPHAGPESDEEYREWAQDKGLYVDVAGNVDYGPPQADGWADRMLSQRLPDDFYDDPEDDDD